jgi:hypothetical protein
MAICEGFLREIGVYAGCADAHKNGEIVSVETFG